MERPVLGDVFRVKKNFNFSKNSFDEGCLVSVVSVVGIPSVNIDYWITLFNTVKHIEFTLTVENFNRYIQEGYFERVNNKKETNMNEQFELQVGDIVETEDDVFTVIKDVDGDLCAISHNNGTFLRIINFSVEYIHHTERIVNVYRHSTVPCGEFCYGENSLNVATQVYPKPKVKLTLSEIKSKFQIENEEVEIDFEN